MSEEVLLENKVKLVIPASSEYVSLARLALGGLIRNFLSDEEIIEDIKIAVSEVCNSVVLQAENVDNATLDLSFSVQEEEITIDVGCTGKELELAALTPIVWSEPEERGYGLSLISALMDKVELISDDGNKTILRLRKYFPS